MEKVDILGVGISRCTLETVLQNIEQFVDGPYQHYVVTPNPEFLVMASKDEVFKQILNDADIAIADGIGLIKAATMYRKSLFRVTGVDLVYALCELAAIRGWAVYFLGSREGVALKASQKLREQFPDLIVAGAESGGVLNKPHEPSTEILEHINQTQPKILFVAFGHGKQEKWIYHHLDQLPSVKVALGVGGTFDFISGMSPRAPHWLRKIGLEWTYRLVREPRRWRRILDAVAVFPVLVIKDIIHKAFTKNG